MLGGLGLIIGTFGLGIILLRNMLERKQEIALMAAIGYRRRQLNKLVLTEYSILVAAGVLTGLVSALVAIAPSIVSPAFSLQPGFLTGILLLVCLSCFLCIYFPARAYLRRPLVGALRNE